MTTFLLIRHGETDAVGKLLMGWMPGWHLNANGMRQAERLALKLSKFPVRAVYTSPLERAVETARTIAVRFNLTEQTVEELGEMHLGGWQGMTFDALDSREDWKRFNAFRSAQRCPDGELMVETQTRMVGQLERLRRRHPDQTVAIVSHSDLLRSLDAFFIGIPLDFLLRLEISPASITILELSDWAARLICLNMILE